MTKRLPNGQFPSQASPTGLPQVDPDEAKRAVLPLLEGLSENQKEFLLEMAVVGEPYVALKNVRARLGLPIGHSTLVKWKTDDEKFADAYQTLIREYAGRLAVENLVLSVAGKIHGGAATLRIQQLNRLIPEEYLPAIQQQIHQTVSYKAEGEWTEEKPEDKPKDVPSLVDAAREAGDILLVPLAKGKH